MADFAPFLPRSVFPQSLNASFTNRHSFDAFTEQRETEERRRRGGRCLGTGRRLTVSYRGFSKPQFVSAPVRFGSVRFCVVDKENSEMRRQQFLSRAAAAATQFPGSAAFVHTTLSSASSDRVHRPHQSNVFLFTSALRTSGPHSGVGLSADVAR